jgi:hypothetical protein
MSCAEARFHLHLYVGGDLESSLAETVDAHVAACADCTRALEPMRAARGRLLALREDGETPVDLWPRIRAGLSERRPAGSEVAAPRRSAAAAWWLAGLAAAAAALYFFAFGPGAQVPSSGVREQAPPVATVPDAAPAPQEQLASTDGDQLRGLRRVMPGDERLRDHAQPFVPPGSQRDPAAFRGRHSLVSESEWR